MKKFKLPKKVHPNEKLKGGVFVNPNEVKSIKDYDRAMKNSVRNFAGIDTEPRSTQTSKGRVIRRK